MMPSGSSCRRAAERWVSPWMRTSGAMPGSYRSSVTRFSLRVALPASSTAVTVTISFADRRARAGSVSVTASSSAGDRGRGPHAPARLGLRADHARLARAARA